MATRCYHVDIFKGRLCWFYLVLLLLVSEAARALDAEEELVVGGSGGGGDPWPPSDQEPEDWDWTLRPPDPTQAVELEGSNVCTKQET